MNLALLRNLQISGNVKFDVINRQSSYSLRRMSLMRRYAAADTTSNTTSTPITMSAYTAPELLDNADRYSTASDVFALGVLCWEVAERRVPQSVARKRPVFSAVSTLSTIRDVAERSWAQDRDLRPTALQAFKALKATPIL